LPPDITTVLIMKGYPMSLSLFEKITLGISGITALSIGVFILAAPHTFYGSYGITLGDDASLLSELRAPAASLAAFGVLMLAGLARSAFIQVAMVAALTVYLAFPAGRLIGLLVDGMPSTSVIGALALELAIAAMCLTAFRHRLRPGASRRSSSRVTVA